MRIDILTIFPAMFEGPLTESLIKKAREKKILDIRVHDIRSFSTDKHKSVDNCPFGGGAGMVMMPEPLVRAIKSLKISRKDKKDSQVIYLSPQGEKLGQTLLHELSSKKRIVLLCGHYEGIDERVMTHIDREVSIGDYVLTGGELPAMVLIDAVARLVPGVIKEKSSVEKDSFFNGLLDYPHYTRPREFEGKQVPQVLLSGDHALVAKWRKEQSLRTTYKKRLDLLKKAKLSQDDKKFLLKIRKYKE